MQLKEIRRESLKLTSEHRDIPLSVLEQGLSALQHVFETYPPLDVEDAPDADNLLTRIADGSGFMLAAIFDGKKPITILALPEAYDHDNRVVPNLRTVENWESDSDIWSITENIDDFLSAFQSHLKDGERKGVIIIQQNFGMHRKEKPLWLGTWNANVARQHPLLLQYDGWIRDIQTEQPAVHP
jgi:hypothetical protein